MVDESLSREELQAYAAETYGLDLPSTLNKQTMLARIRDVERTQPETDTEATSGYAAVMSADAQGPRVDITIHEQDGVGGDAPVFLQVNGYAVQIKRGERVSVRPEFVGVLDDAIEKKYIPRRTGVEERSVKRFSYTVHGPSGALQ